MNTQELRKIIQAGIEIEFQSCAPITKHAHTESLWSLLREALQQYVVALRLDLARGTDWDVEFVPGPMNKMEHHLKLTGKDGSQINLTLSLIAKFMLGVLIMYRPANGRMSDIKGWSMEFDSFRSGLGSEIIRELQKQLPEELKAGKFN